MADRDFTEEEFRSLREEPLHKKRGAEWDDYYARMAAFLICEKPEIRYSALERLCMAVFSAEPSSLPYAERDHAAMVARLDWLRGVVESAAERFADTKRVFVGHMRYHGDRKPFDTPLRRWFDAWLAVADDERLHEQLRGAIILHTPVPVSDDTARQWLGLLDDPSDYVRACAAHQLSVWVDETTSPSERELFDLIAEKDIARPGVAGPFWSDRSFGWKAEGGEVEDGFDPAEWMMNILAKRNGPEPDNLPFNGIDFHLHELCAHSPERVRRMIDLGHKGLALMTATEHDGVVEGMEPLLLQLGEDNDPEIAKRAIWQLAYNYRTLHPRAAEFGVTRDAEWDRRAVKFTVPHPNRIFTEIYPLDPDAAFSDEDAWRLIDRLVSPERRGRLRPYLAAFDQTPAPYAIGEKLIYNFERAYVSLRGDLNAKLWTQIRLVQSANA